jgi:hypothetical protein
MRNSVLPVMGVLTVVAAAVGLQIGESAIAQIDPTYFQGPMEPAQDVTRNPQRRPGYAQASGWAQGYAAKAVDCGDCPAHLTRQTHAAVYSAPAYADATIAPRWEDADAPVTLSSSVEEVVRPAEGRRIDRYLHFPVSADQAQIARALDSAPPETQAPTAQAEGPAGL